jgi:flagellar biosynthesis/type III secretory pathway chaperone
MNNLISNIKQTLEELNDVVQLLNDEQFSTPLTIFSGSSTGMHARHIIEFYQCLLTQSLDNQSVNYDQRKRDLLLQGNTEYFTSTVNIVIEALQKLDCTRLNNPLSITSEDAETDATPINSSLARELQYNLEHTIHHAAFIKIGVLTQIPDAYLPKTFGVAPSTLRHQKQA